MKPKPFLKWLGGKRRLIPKVIHRFPRTWGRWIEPFVGGGSVLFHFLPEKAYVSDGHEDLINTYRWIRDDVETTSDLLECLRASHTYEHFYECRDWFNEERDLNPLRAARFIYLNCKCFNGLCRYNSKGNFNAPIHKISHLTRKIPSPDELRAVATYLANVEIEHRDFRKVSVVFEPGDFVMMDPPYWPYWEAGFTNYTGDSFGEKDQYDLVKMMDALTRYGVLVMLWNSDVPKVREIYGSYDIASVDIKNCVGQKSYGGKKPMRSEVCIINYDPETGKVLEQ